MESASAASELLWEQQQRADKAQADLEHREWLASFALVFSLIVLAIGVGTALAGLGAEGTNR